MRLKDLLDLGLHFLFLGLILGIISYLIGYKLIYKKICRKNSTIPVQTLGLYLLFICYLVIVFGGTLGRSGGVHHEATPHGLFNSYLFAWHSGSFMEWRNLVFNILMFIPLGVFCPLLVKRLARPYLTYIIGLSLSLGIEILQLISGIGIFEVDDLLNNTVGCMIGFGIYSLGVYFIKKKFIPLRQMILAQVPLIATTLAFLTLFTIYQAQELGNLSITPITAYSDIDVQTHPNLVLSDQRETVMIYKTPIGTEEDTLKLANQLLAVVDATTTGGRIERYPEAVYYFSSSGEYQVAIEYTGLGVSFNTFALESEMTGESKQTVLAALAPFNLDLPDIEQLEFSENEYNRYEFKADLIPHEDGVVDGNLTVALTSNGDLIDFTNHLIHYTPYQEIEIMSELEAYNKLVAGEFKWYNPAIEFDQLVLEDIHLDYMTDSKGFYRPIYVFDVLIHNQPDKIMIPAT